MAKAKPKKRRVGRPTKEIVRGKYMVYLEPDIIGEVDRLAARMDLSRSELMRNLLVYGLNDLVGFERVGLIRAVEEFRQMRNFLRQGDLNLGEPVRP